jgi:hypothetical protein
MDSAIPALIRSPPMKEPNRDRIRAVITDVVGVAILGILMATVVEALSPENLLRQDSVNSGSTAGMSAALKEKVNQPA